MSASSSNTIPLASQVGGHAGVQTTEDGSLIIKPALPLEHKFYSTLVGTRDDEKLAGLRGWVPRFYGTLKLHKDEEEAKKELENVGKAPGEAVAAAASASSSASSPSEKESLVLENLSYGFIKPNILDIKLGTVLYDSSASQEKKERMIKTAKETTSFETGVRLTGFQVYDNSTGKAVNTPKSYGKSISAAQLPEGITKFFPTSDGKSGLGLPAPMLYPILTHILDDVKRVREIISGIEMRMVGGSLLVVYEGDIGRVKAGVKPTLPKPKPEVKAEAAKAEDESDEEDFGEEEESDDEVVTKAFSDGTSSSSEDESSDLDSDDLNSPAEAAPKASSSSSRMPLYRVRLIDFAHTSLVPGQGHDQGVLKGFDTTIKLLEGRVREVRKIIDSSDL